MNSMRVEGLTVLGNIAIMLARGIFVDRSHLVSDANNQGKSWKIVPLNS